MGLGLSFPQTASLRPTGTPDSHFSRRYNEAAVRSERESKRGSERKSKRAREQARDRAIVHRPSARGSKRDALLYRSGRRSEPKNPSQVPHFSTTARYGILTPSSRRPDASKASYPSPSALNNRFGFNWLFHEPSAVLKLFGSHSSWVHASHPTATAIHAARVCCNSRRRRPNGVMRR